MKIHCAIFSIFFLIACNKKNNIRIDNPGDTSLSITIDSDQYTLNANAFQEISLSQGTHTLEYANQKETLVLESEKEYLLNPRQSTYILKEFFFLDSALAQEEAERMSAKASRLQRDTVVWGEYEFSGNVTSSTALLIERNWDYSSDETLPAEVAQDSDISSKIKIFRLKDFLKTESK